MTATELAAWWGAGLATLVLIWDAYKWLTSGRPKLTMRALIDLVRLERENPGCGDFNCLGIEICNRGDATTTLTQLGLVRYRSSWRLRAVSLGLPVPGPNVDLPHTLGPGERWVGMIRQTNEFEDLMTGGNLYCVVHHSASDKPARVRVTRSSADRRAQGGQPD